jgi:hypothetical protein
MLSPPAKQAARPHNIQGFCPGFMPDSLILLHSGKCSVIPIVDPFVFFYCGCAPGYELLVVSCGCKIIRKTNPDIYISSL